LKNGNGRYKSKDNKEFPSQSDKNIKIPQILDNFVPFLLFDLIILLEIPSKSSKFSTKLSFYFIAIWGFFRILFDFDFLWLDFDSFYYEIF